MYYVHLKTNHSEQIPLDEITLRIYNIAMIQAYKNLHFTMICC